MSVSPKRDASEGTTKDNVQLRCGDCMHYKGTVHPAYNEPCSTRGVRPGGIAPPCYTPNIGILRRHSMDTVRVLSALVTQFTPQECRILMGMLNKASRLERHGFSFLEKVYFRLGDPYLTNYYHGYVMGTGIENTILILGAKAMDGRRPMIAHLAADSVIPSRKWRKLKLKLIDAGRINDPELRRKKLVHSAAIDYEPPSIDSSQQDLEEHIKAKAGSKVVRRKGSLDITLKVRRHGEEAVGDE